MKQIVSWLGQAVVASTLLAGCVGHVDVYEKYHKSVVMLFHTYYYKVVVGANTWYFTYDKNTNKINEWSTDPNAIKLPMAAYGTGFFIDGKGRIVTNKHVVDDWFKTDERNVRNTLRDWAQNNKLLMANKRDTATRSISEWSAVRYDMSRYQYERDYAAGQVDSWGKLQKQYAADEAYWEGLLSSLGEAQFSVETVFLGCALDGAYTERMSDYKECIRVAISKDDNIDLAVIQTKDRKLPAEITSPINIDEIESNSSFKVGDEVSLIGYNWGPLIANSNQGLHVQKTDGRISQEPDGVRVLYSIPSLPGSSGSPVFNKDGRLVAIHYAGISSTQSFNYGVLAKHLKALLNQ